MEQLGNCNLVFPRQGPDDGHAFIFHKSPYKEEVSFHIGQGYDGELNKLSGDGLNVGDQIKLICQFFWDPHLKHLRVDVVGRLWEETISKDPHLKYLRVDVVDCLWEGTISTMDHSYLIWATFIRELQGNASLEYIEFTDFPYSPKNRGIRMRPILEMLSTTPSLLGIKILFSKGEVDVRSFMKVVSTNESLQLLHLTFSDEISSIFSTEALQQLMASFIPDSTGYQSNTTLRVLFMAILPFHFYGIFSMITKRLIETFINMLETNKTLTTIQIPDFVCTVEDIVKVLCALEVNQSIRNIIFKDDYEKSFKSNYWDGIRYEEFSRGEVFSRLLKLIKFRIDHGNGLSTVDVRGISLENLEYDVHIQSALKKKYNDGSHGEFFVRPMSCRIFLCGFPEVGKTTL